MPLWWPIGKYIAKFLQLEDTPGSYSGQAKRVAKVTDAEDGLEFGSLEPKEFHNVGASAYRDTVQSIPDSTWTRVQLNKKDWDLANNFNVSTYRFTATVPGYYLVACQVAITFAAANSRVIAGVYKNGARVASFRQQQTIDNRQQGAGGARIIHLAQNEYLELYTFQDSGAAKDTLDDKTCVYMDVVLWKRD